MYDFRPVGYLLGMHVIALGVSMLAPLLLDLSDGNDNARGFFLAAFLTLAAGIALMLVCRQADRRGGLSRPQAFLLTVLLWTAIPAFAAFAFVFGAPHVGYTDAFFEAMSGITTTGSTVFSGLDTAPRGMLLWRALLQWYGGLGIVIVAILFFPAMRIGGMQFFRTVSFDVSGSEVIPQATRIASDLTYLYLALTLACILSYAAAGMSIFDAICHAMTTVPTGGYANYDASFGHFGPAAQYVAILFMALSAIPFIRLIELAKNRGIPLWRDQQIEQPDVWKFCWERVRHPGIPT